MNYKEIAKLFSNENVHFGIRGNGALWRYMKAEFERHFGDITDINEFREKLFEIFNDITGCDLQLGSMVYVELLDPGHGISSGAVSLSWWYMIGIPVLCSRFNEHKSPYISEEEFLKVTLPIAEKMMDNECGKEYKYKKMMDREIMDLQKKITSTIIGGAIGDALGVPVEFKPRGSFKVTDMIGYGTYNQPKGTWSDDTTMTLCLMENVIEGGDDEALMGKFLDWMENGYMTPHGKCFDIGGTTSRAIIEFKNGTLANQCGQFGEKDNGNGALMRIAPVVFLNYKMESPQERLATVERYSSLTHAHPRSILGCFIYTECLRQLLLGKEKSQAIGKAIEICDTRSSFEGTMFEARYENEFSHYSRILNGKIGSLEKDSIRSGGYVVDTLEAALWCFLRNNSYEDTVLEAVNLGGDTDTTAIVAGSVAGMYYYDAIPEKWISSLAKIDNIKGLCRKFADAVQ